MGILSRLAGYMGYIKSDMGSMSDFENKMDSCGVKSDSGTVVTPLSAMQQSTVYSCVKVLAEAQGSLPLQFFEKQPDGSAKKITDYPLQRLFSIAPNQRQTPIDMNDTIVSQMCLRGKSYYQIIRDGIGNILSLEPLCADKMEMAFTDNGTMFFVYKLENGTETVLQKEQVWYTYGFLGLSPITLMANSIGMAIALEKHGGKFFENGARPDGVLTHPGKLSDNAMNAMRKNWTDLYNGVDKSHKIAILMEGLSYTPLTMSAEDAQFLENRRFQKEEIASIFRVPMHMVNSLERATFSNIEHQDLGFVKHTVRPQITRVEQSITRDLIPEKDQGRIFASYNLDAILRGAFKDQMEAFKTGIESGQLNPNEARAVMDRPPYIDGDKFIKPMNMDTVGGEDDNEDEGTENDDM